MIIGNFFCGGFEDGQDIWFPVELDLFFERIDGLCERHGSTVSVAMEGYNGWARPLDTLVRTPGCGIVPSRRVDGAQHEVASFSSVRDSRQPSDDRTAHQPEPGLRKMSRKSLNPSAPGKLRFLNPQILSGGAGDDGRRNGSAAQRAKRGFLNESHARRFNRCIAGPARILLIVFAGLVSAAQVMADTDHAVVLLYHHVSDRTPPSTSVTPQQFQRHLEFLHEHEFDVWPLERVVERLLEQSSSVPDNVVAITFDDAYQSVHEQAWPMLEKYGWTATVFVNTDAVDQAHEPYMNWDQLRELAGAGFALGNHSASHAHLLEQEPGETDAEWRRRVTEDIRRAESRILDETGLGTRLLAYPFGEDSIELAGLIDSLGYRGLTQRSGAIGAHSDDRAIPRFPMAQGFDSIERLELAVRSRPLPVTHVRYQPPREQGVVENPAALHFEVRPGGWRQSQLACYSGSGTRLNQRIEDHNEASAAVTVEIADHGKPGRNRLNCTAPAEDGSGDYYWHAFQWLQLRPDGTWARDN